MAAAQRYEAVVPLDDLMENAVEQIAQSVPQDQRATFIQRMNSIFDRVIDSERLRQFYIRQLAATFTTAELDALTEFYGSAEGQSVMHKMPEFTAALMPVLQQELLRAVQTNEQRP